MDVDDEIQPSLIPRMPCQLLLKAGSCRGLTVLVVEDEDFVSKATAEILQAAGYSVLVARNAEQAIDICSQNSPSIDLLLADLILPRMSGRELANQFMRLFPGSSVLLMTGYAGKIPLENSTCGCMPLAKPFSAAMLLQKIHELLRTQAPAEASIDSQHIPT